MGKQGIVRGKEGEERKKKWPRKVGMREKQGEEIGAKRRGRFEDRTCAEAGGRPKLEMIEKSSAASYGSITVRGGEKPSPGSDYASDEAYSLLALGLLRAGAGHAEPRHRDYRYRRYS